MNNPISECPKCNAVMYANQGCPHGHAQPNRITPQQRDYTIVLIIIILLATIAFEYYIADAKLYNEVRKERTQ